MALKGSGFRALQVWIHGFRVQGHSMRPAFQNCGFPFLQQSPNPEDPKCLDHASGGLALKYTSLGLIRA